MSLSRVRAAFATFVPVSDTALQAVLARSLTCLPLKLESTDTPRSTLLVLMYVITDPPWYSSLTAHYLDFHWKKIGITFSVWRGQDYAKNVYVHRKISLLPRITWMSPMSPAMNTSLYVPIYFTGTY